MPTPALEDVVSTPPLDPVVQLGAILEDFVFEGPSSNFSFLFAWVLSAACGAIAPRIRCILDMMAVHLLAHASFR